MSRMRVLALAAATAAALSCLPPARAPMRAVTEREPGGAARTLVVFLPGRGSTPETYLREGFARIARDRGLRADLVFADAELGYYVRGTITARLHDDVIAPARSRGYDRVVLVGISLGGLGAVLYAREHPADVDTLVLLSPYLVDQAISPPSVIAQAFRGHEVWLGFGRDERLRASCETIAATLPAGRVLVAPGGHRWRTWIALWSELLGRSSFERGLAHGVPPPS